jgi:hypothetical protein
MSESKKREQISRYSYLLYANEWKRAVKMSGRERYITLLVPVVRKRVEGSGKKTQKGTERLQRRAKASKRRTNLLYTNE